MSSDNYTTHHNVIQFNICLNVEPPLFPSSKTRLHLVLVALVVTKPQFMVSHTFSENDPHVSTANNCKYIIHGVQGVHGIVCCCHSFKFCFSSWKVLGNPPVWDKPISGSTWWYLDGTSVSTLQPFYYIDLQLIKFYLLEWLRGVMNSLHILLVCGFNHLGKY